jgi:hypothetical protein
MKLVVNRVPAVKRSKSLDSVMTVSLLMLNKTGCYDECTSVSSLDAPVGRDRPSTSAILKKTSMFLYTPPKSSWPGPKAKTGTSVKLWTPWFAVGVRVPLIMKPVGLSLGLT